MEINAVFFRCSSEPWFWILDFDYINWVLSSRWHWVVWSPIIITLLTQLYRNIGIIIIHYRDPYEPNRMSLPTEKKLKTEGKADSHFAGRPLSFGESTPLHMESVHEGPNRRFPPILEIIVLQVPAVHLFGGIFGYLLWRKGITRSRYWNCVIWISWICWNPKCIFVLIHFYLWINNDPS